MINPSLPLQAGGYCPAARGCWPASAPPATQTVETGNRVHLPPLYSRHHIVCCCITPSARCVLQAVAHPSELRRPVRGGGQRPEAKRRQRDDQSRCGRRGGGPERNCGAAGGEELRAEVMGHSNSVFLFLRV